MKTPVLFIGHGNPMNAIEKNPWADAIRELGKSLEKPRAVLIVSAHWQTQGTKVSVVEHPKTIHDFGNFPQELFDVQYPAPGSQEVAQEVISLLKPMRAMADKSWGLDHGAWSVLVHLFPESDVPCFQVSLDQALNERAQYEIGKIMRPLRDEGVLILGTGNVVHNLKKINWRDPHGKAYEWCIEFDQKIKEAIQKGDDDAVLNNRNLWFEISQQAHPTDEHLRPLFYCLGAREKDEPSKLIYEGLEMGSLSMQSWRFG